MIIYDYVVYGGGPTGMTLAYILSKNNYKVALIEKESKLGGCWKVEWQQNKYFTEHSPRVLLENNSSFFNLLKNIGFDYKKETVNTYGNTLQSSLKFMKFFLQNLTLSDYFKIFIGRFNLKNYTITEWMNNLNLSSKAKKAFTLFSILLANSPDKLLISEMFKGVSLPVKFIQFTDNEKWINLLEIELIKNKVDIFKNHSLENLIYHTDSLKIEQGNLRFTKTWTGKSQRIIVGKNHLLTFPPKAMYDFLNKQIDVIRNNWIQLKGNKLNQWLEDSTYYSFGFQLHFKQSKLENPNLDISKDDWCWSCMNDYNLIILPTSDFQKVYSKDNTIKTVWSCTIVDTDRTIKKLNKTINKMSKQQIIDDVLNYLFQLKNITPDIITFYDGVKKDIINGKIKWTSKDSAFSVGKSGVVPSEGKINNLSWIGSHNQEGITVINKAVDIAVQWTKNKKFNTFRLDIKRNYFFEIIIIIVLIYVILKVSQI